jgi:hypothetical protein
MSEETVNQVETTTAEAAEAEGQVSLGIGDLASIVQIIDVCSQRGAFQGSEMEAVGALRGRIQQFVKANTPDEEQEEQTEGENND